MNPIEKHWHELKTFLRTRVKPRTKEELVNGINKFWNDLNSARCSRYIDHLEKVFPAVVAREGSFNNYVTQNYKILTYLPIFVTLFYNKISFYM